MAASGRNPIKHGRPAPIENGSQPLDSRGFRLTFPRFQGHSFASRTLVRVASVVNSPGGWREGERMLVRAFVSITASGKSDGFRRPVVRA